MDDNRSAPGCKPEALGINKGILLDSFKAACLVASWARSVNRNPDGRPTARIEDAELDEDMAQWSILEALSRDELRSYDQLEDPDQLVALMSGLSLTLLLSSDRAEAYSIRREWAKIGAWLKLRYSLDPALPGSTFLDLAREGLAMPVESAYLVVEHMPELKQGWDEGGAEGVRDYLTVLSLGMREKGRLE